MDERQTRLYFVALDELNLPLTSQVSTLTKRQKDKINELSKKWEDRDEELITLFDKIVSDGLFDKVSIFETLPIKDKHITHQPPCEVTRPDEPELKIDPLLSRGY